MPRTRRDATLTETLTIAQLHAKGHSVAQIAKALQLTPSICHAAITESRQLLEALAPKFVEDLAKASHIAAEQGDHRPAIAALDRIKVTEATASEQAGVTIKVEVTSGFLMPGLPSAPTTSPTSTTTSRPALPEPTTIDVFSVTPSNHGEPVERMDIVAAPPGSRDVEHA